MKTYEKLSSTVLFLFNLHWKKLESMETEPQEWVYIVYISKQSLQVFHMATVSKHCPREKAEIQAAHKHS